MDMYTFDHFSWVSIFLLFFLSVLLFSSSNFLIEEPNVYVCLDLLGKNEILGISIIQIFDSLASWEKDLFVPYQSYIPSLKLVFESSYDWMNE